MDTDVYMNKYKCAYDLASLSRACILLYEHPVHFNGNIGEGKSCHAKPSGGSDLRWK